jgi:hypothetical protein
MNRTSWFAVYGSLGVLLVAACRLSGSGVAVPERALPAPTERPVLATPAALGESILWRGLRLAADRTELTGSFTTEFGSQRLPSAGQKFLWAHLVLEAAGEAEIERPGAAHFSVLYAESEFKPIYGHRQGYPDYTDLDTSLFPGQKMDGWLRFDIPESARLPDLMVVFLPESLHVAVSPDSPGYPWSDRFATFVWLCAP